MGYTNYWEQEKSFSDNEWKQIKDEYDYIKQVCNSTIIDQTESDDEIVFNGVNEMEHETFIFIFVCVMLRCVFPPVVPDREFEGCVKFLKLHVLKRT